MASDIDTRVLTLLTEAWRLDRPEPTWLTALVDAAEAVLCPDMGIVGAIAQAGRASAADLSVVPFAKGLPDNLFPVMDQLVTMARATSDLRRNFASRAPVMTFSEFSCYAQLSAILEPVGVRDVAIIFAGRVFGSSLALAASYRERKYFTPRERETLVAAAGQLAVAFNCQRHTQALGADDLAKLLRPETTSVELRCAELLALGLETKEIAQALGISADAVRKHISNGMKRHGVRTREELVERVAGPGIRLAG